jgi:hypothetical protein
MRAAILISPTILRSYEMNPNIKAFRRNFSNKSYSKFYRPLVSARKRLPELKSEGNKPLSFTFDEQLDVLIYFHLQGFESGRHLLQALEEDKMAKELVAPEKGLKKSTFFEAINSRGLEQLLHVYNNLCDQAKEVLPYHHPSLGNIVGIDGSLISATLSMNWADYRQNVNKAKVHLGFDVNQGIPSRFFLTDGKADERPFVSKMIEPGQTGVLDRYYQKHEDFDNWQSDQINFVCRIKESTRIEVVYEYDIPKGSIVTSDALVLLGSQGVNQTKQSVRLVRYKVDGNEYLVVTNRFDLKAEDVALIYKLRWEIEKFFAWWKRQLKVYHLIARTQYGMMVQIISGLITYLLLAIYCHNEHGEKVNIKRVRELRTNILNESLACRSPRRRKKGKSRKKKRKRPNAKS